MRYFPAHAATSGSVPFTLHGSKPLRTAMSVAVAGIIGLVPAVMIAAPASAVSTVLSIASATATEGADVTFTLTYTGTAAASYTITTTSTASASATDYTPTPNPTVVSFPAGPGPQTASVTVATADDTLDETDETFGLNAQNTLTQGDNAQAVGTIVDNDVTPSYTLTATPSTVTEAAGARSTITATLSAASGQDVAISLNTQNGTAVQPRDYTPLVNQPILIPAGSRTGTADVFINNDGVRDDLTTETFTVDSVANNVSNPANTVTVSITDAQSDPVITLTGGGSVAEGASATYTVNIAPQSDRAVTVNWNATAATPVAGRGSATPGADFAYPSSRTVTIPAGQSAATFSIAATADNIDELAEDFAVELTNPVNATLGSPVRMNTTITDNAADTAPAVTIAPTSVVEGDTGRNARTFTATLNAPSGRDVTVNYTANTDGQAPGLGYAAAVRDFTVKSGTLTFPAGTTTQTFTVEIAGDTIDEGNGETFAIRLSDVDGSATLGTGTTIITITDDDSAPSISFADKTVEEGDDGSAVLLPLILNGSSDRPLTFDVTVSPSAGTADEDGTAIGENDYDLLTETITIPAESTIPGYVVVLVNGDYVFEQDETANFTVTAATGSAAFVTNPDTLSAQLTIENDDLAPDLEINDVTGEEGTTVPVTGRVTGISATATTVNVVFAGGSSNGSVAANADDFTNPGVTQIVIPAGTTPGSDIPVASLVLVADDLAEGAETIRVTGFGLSNEGTVTEGVITIAASDGGTDPTDPTDPTNPNDPESITVIGPYRTLKGSFDLTGLTEPFTNLQLFSAPYTGEDDSWVAEDVTQSSSTGAFIFNPSLTNTGRRYEVRAGETVSNEAAVRLSQAPTLAGTSSGRGIAALRAANGVPKSPFIIQRANGRTWNSLFTGTLQSTGTYYKALSGQPSGQTFSYRVYVYGNSFTGVDGAYSAPRSVRIR